MKMQSQLTFIFKMLLLIVVSFSCMEQSSRKGKPFIPDFSIAAPDANGCGTDFFVIKEIACIAACAEGTHIASAEELELIAAEVSEEIQGVIDNSAGVCLDDVEEVTRPTDAVVVKNNFCSCIGGKPDIINNCSSICAGTNTTAATLSGSVTVTEDISLNTAFGSPGTLWGWCNKEIDDGLVAPSCVLEVFDGSSTIQLPINIPTNSNTFNAVLSNLQFDVTYVAKIVEAGSGSGAKSSSFQFKRKQQVPDQDYPDGPLKIMPVSQYTCVTRSGEVQSGQDIFENAARVHYYFPSSEEPPPLAPGNNFLICHDINQHGNNDSSLYPRLELIPQHFAVWDQSDIRFVDQGNGQPKINKIISDRLLQEFGITQETSIFSLFSWPNRPDSNSTPPNVGFFMTPWINPQTGRGFCPTDVQYNGSEPLFKVLKEFVGIDTEGIYLSEKEPELIDVTDEGEPVQAPQDILIIREGLLKKIWFYYENGVYYTPNDTTAGQKTVRFYWPADPVHPHVKKSNQRLYTVRAPETIGAGGSRTGLSTVLRPPDKRFGCVPALSSSSE